MVAGKDPAGFNNRLVKSVERAVERHATAWESNLAAAYREGLTSEELSIACDAMKRGDRAAFAPLGEKAGKAMEARSTEFLNQIGGEVLPEMWSEVAHR
jgi:HD superfamily phosphodiesterase